ncbi:hypothetical protein [Secundilactobacillus silagei]|uniref:hypothetical protein n=1 Tax=Secundilactobacillus silagei TaxID=1293415 RepID=UPI00209269DB|nr:hypothetical protein [Secundilactobacillus silagei]
MQVQEMTNQFQHATDFQSQALYQLAQQQRLVALQFTQSPLRKRPNCKNGSVNWMPLSALMVTRFGDY